MECKTYRFYRKYGDKPWSKDCIMVLLGGTVTENREPILLWGTTMQSEADRMIKAGHWCQVPSARAAEILKEAGVQLDVQELSVL